MFPRNITEWVIIIITRGIETNEISQNYIINHNNKIIIGFWMFFELNKQKFTEWINVFIMTCVCVCSQCQNDSAIHENELLWLELEVLKQCAMLYLVAFQIIELEICL